MPLPRQSRRFGAARVAVVLHSHGADVQPPGPERRPLRRDEYVDRQATDWR